MTRPGDGSGVTDLRCERLRRLTVEDDARLDALRAHAEECPACASFLTEERALRAATDDWRRATSAAPPVLRSRVLEAVARVGANERPGGGGRPSRRRHVAAWTAAAAALLLFAVALSVGFPDALRTDVVSVSGRLLVDDALAAARRAEREHAEAIAALSAATAPILARADASDLPPRELARLLAWRDRLASVDDAIRQVESFLDSNPGHPSARTLLLAAYIDKTDLLSEILAAYPMEDA